FSSYASATISSGLIILAYSFGKLKQPSSTSCEPFVFTILGFTSFKGPLSSYKSITITLFRIPTCGAARPTPLYLCIVSSMSFSSSLILSSTSSTSLDFFLKISSPFSLITLIANVFIFFITYYLDLSLLIFLCFLLLCFGIYPLHYLLILLYLLQICILLKFSIYICFLFCLLEKVMLYIVLYLNFLLILCFLSIHV